MFRNACQRTYKLTRIDNSSKLYCINLTINHISKKYQSKERANWYAKDKNNTNSPESKELVKVEPRQIFEKEFPEYFSDGKFITRISYVDYIDQALEKLKELGLEKDINAYKELLKVFPPGKYHPKSSWDLGLFHAPQQLCAVRLLFQMESNMIKPDKEIESLVISAFSKSSKVWVKCARMLYWSMKGRNVDRYPLPEVLPKKNHEIAKVALMRMLDNPKSVISVKNTSSLPNVVDKTWVVFSQNPHQQLMIERLDKKTILYIEKHGLTYVGDKYLNYFVLKCYDDLETIEKRKQKVEPSYNYNTIKMQFYGKPIEEKLAELNNINQVDDGHILGVAITGTSSHDSVLSWLKLLQQRNPNLKHLNVVFRLKSPVAELLDPSNDPNK